MPHATSGFTGNELILQAIATKGRTSSDLSSDTTLRSQLLEGLSLIQFDYCGREDWHFLHTNGTVSAVSGTSTYSLSSDCEKIEVLYDKTNNRIIRPTSDKILTQADPNEDWTGAAPEVYSRWGDQSIIIQPTPNTSLTLYYRYKQLPTYLSAVSDYLTVPFKYQKTILHGLKAWFYDITDDTRADRERGLFENGIIKDWEKDTLDLDNTSRFIPYEEWCDNPISSTYEDYLARYFG